MQQQLARALRKARGHKYLRREATGDPQRPWRYIYRDDQGKEYEGKAPVAKPADVRQAGLFDAPVKPAGPRVRTDEEIQAASDAKLEVERARLQALRSLSSVQFVRLDAERIAHRAADYMTQGLPEAERAAALTWTQAVMAARTEIAILDETPSFPAGLLHGLPAGAQQAIGALGALYDYLRDDDDDAAAFAAVVDRARSPEDLRNAASLIAGRFGAATRRDEEQGKLDATIAGLQELDAGDLQVALAASARLVARAHTRRTADAKLRSLRNAPGSVPAPEAVALLQLAQESPALRSNMYAEGFLRGDTLDTTYTHAPDGGKYANALASGQILAWGQAVASNRFARSVAVYGDAGKYRPLDRDMRLEQVQDLGEAADTLAMARYVKAQEHMRKFARKDHPTAWRGLSMSANVVASLQEGDIIPLTGCTAFSMHASVANDYRDAAPPTTRDGASASVLLQLRRTVAFDASVAGFRGNSAGEPAFEIVSGINAIRVVHIERDGRGYVLDVEGVST